MPDPRERRWLLAICLVAVAVRVVWCVYAARPPSEEIHDPNFYRFFGEQLAGGRGYRLPDGAPTAYYPPGYAMSLAPLFWFSYVTPLPDDWETGIIAAANIVWQVVTVLAVWVIARRLAGPAAGLVAAAVVAAWPNLVFHSAVALSESLFLALFTAAMAVAVAGPWSEGRARFGVRRTALVGVLLGASTLVRPVAVPMLGALGVAFLLARAGWRRAIVQTAGCAVAMLVVLLPWVVRNAVVMDAITFSTNTGDNLCMSRRVGGSGTFELSTPRCFSGDFDDLPRPEYELERDAHGRRLAIEFIREHPGEELRLIGRRIEFTFHHDHDGIAAVESYGSDPFLRPRVRSALERVADWYFYVAGTVGAAGLALLARRSAPGLVVALSAVGVLIPPLVFFGDARFHVPAVPLLAVGVGGVLAALVPSLRGGSAGLGDDGGAAAGAGG